MQPRGRFEGFRWEMRRETASQTARRCARELFIAMRCSFQILVETTIIRCQATMTTIQFILLFTALTLNVMVMVMMYLTVAIVMIAMVTVIIAINNTVTLVTIFTINTVTTAVDIAIGVIRFFILLLTFGVRYPV